MGHKVGLSASKMKGTCATPIWQRLWGVSLEECHGVLQYIIVRDVITRRLTDGIADYRCEFFVLLSEGKSTAKPLCT